MAVYLSKMAATMVGTTSFKATFPSPGRVQGNSGRVCKKKSTCFSIFLSCLIYLEHNNNSTFHQTMT